MGPNETNPVLMALDEITEAMFEVAVRYRGQLTQQRMPARIADAAIVQSTIAALVALEVMRLKEQRPETDLAKLAEDVDQIRAKTKVALQAAMLEAAKKNDPAVGAARDIALEEYLGEEFSWPPSNGRKGRGRTHA